MKKNNKGFTLAELLIVVAIIAVLVAIAVPVFTQQLEKSREATDMSNVRSAYAEAIADYLSNGATGTVTKTATARQVQSGWQNSENGKLETRIDGSESTVEFSAITSGGTYQVTVSAGANGSTTVTVGTAGGGTNPAPNP